MKQLLVVFIGGGIGSIFRYLSHKWLNGLTAAFPLGTFFANIVGSLIIGFILGLALKSNSISEHTTLLLATGFCGGLTTFSTFAYENAVFLKTGDYLHFIFYSVLSFAFGILAVFAGMWMAKFI